MNKKYFVTNVVAPVSIGAIFYYLFFPDTIFVKWIESLFGVSYHILINPDSVFLKITRFYLPDFLWAYALMGAVVCFCGYEKGYFYSVILFEILLEMLQMLPSTHGTFDICDIFMEVGANILVIKMIKNTEGELENEKVKSI
ncbi:MAG: hypothetical protein ACI4FV_01970 [Lachnospiraceae bacterium]